MDGRFVSKSSSTVCYSGKMKMVTLRRNCEKVHIELWIVID